MTRSNRPLTLFAVGKIQEFLDLGLRRFQPARAGNTSVTLKQEGDICTLCIWLFHQPIIELYFVGDYFDRLVISDGKFYDKAGNPSRTTRERLNGILDQLGELCLIPEGVRVFLADQRTKCYIGRGEVREPFGRGYPDVVINAHPVTLEFNK